MRIRHGSTRLVFRTETRVLSTDPGGRARFRWYWSFFSPGIVLIRWMSLGPLKKDAERQARKARLEQQTVREVHA